MRNSHRFVSPLLILAGAVAHGADTPQFDFDAINANLRATLLEFSAQEDTIDRLIYALNPETSDIDKDRYGFDVELALSETPWSSEALTASGRMLFATDLDDPTEKGFRLEVDATISHRDILGMIKHNVAAMSRCEIADDTAGVKGILWRRHCAYVERLAEVPTVADLAEFLTGKVKDHVNDLEQYAASLRGYNALMQQHVGAGEKQGQAGGQSTQATGGQSTQATGGQSTQATGGLSSQAAGAQSVQTGSELGRLIQSELDHAGRVLGFLSEVEIAKTDGGVVLRVPKMDVCPFFGLAGITAEISADTARISGGIRVNFGKSIYAASRPIVMELLRGIEVGDEASLKLVRWDAQQFANWLMLQ